MRIVREGQPGNLLRLTGADLPADFDLRNSYVRYCDISGADLSAYDMRDSDILDCDARNVVLPDGHRTAYLMSRRTNWRNATLPPTLITYCHDLTRELLRQLLILGLQQARPNDWKTVAQKLQEYLSQVEGTYEDCLENIIHRALQYTTTAKLVRWANELFQPFPLMHARLSNIFLTSRASATLRPPHTPLTALPIEQMGISVDVSAAVSGLDRYQAARDIEAYLLTLGLDCYVYVAQLDPRPHAYAIPRSLLVPDRWDWWSGFWGAE